MKTTEEEDRIESLKIDKHLLNRQFSSYNRPTVVGYFSLDSDRNFHNDLSQLQYVRIGENLLEDGERCRVEYDLDKGRENAITRNDKVEEQLNNLIKWLLENEKSKESSIAADVVCYRGVLSLLMCTPYENQEGWILCATKLRGTMFLCQFDTEEKTQRIESMTDRDKQFLYWGRKFEKYMCSDKPGSRPDPSVPVNENEELCLIFTTTLNNRRLLFGAEMDGILNCSREVKSCEELTQSRLVELKTSRKIESSKQHNSFKRFKLLKWWTQSYLVGIKYLLCGFRDDQGIVHNLEQFHVSRIPEKAWRSWDPKVCVNFCDTFLQFADSIVQQERPETVWKFEWKPGQDVTAVRIEGPSQYSFLPPWFIEQYGSGAKSKT